MTLTPDQFRELLVELGLSDAQLIRWTGVDDRLVRRWKTGEREIPETMATWLKGLETFLTANPPPVMRGRARENI